MNIARGLPRFRRAAEALKHLASRECWSRAEIEAHQLERVNELWRRAVREVPHYREALAANELPDSFGDLEEFRRLVPPLEKETVRADPGRLLSGAHGPGEWRRTGGSTGAPMRIFWSHAAHREMLWTKYRMEQAWGLDIFDRKAFLWGHSASFARGLVGHAQRVKQPVLDWLRNRIRLNAYRLGEEDLAGYLEKINRFGARSLYGYSSAVALLAEVASRRAVSCPTLRLAILTAEPAETAMLDRCRESLSEEAAIEYGSVECGVIATGMPDGTLRIREDRVLLEAIPTDSDRHELLVTVLDNPSFPLLRYRIGDTIEKALEAPASGYQTLASVVGRTNDVLIAASGRPVHSLVIKHALEQLDGVRRFSAHQGPSGDINVTLECLTPPPQAVAEEVESRLTRLMEGRLIALSYTDRIAGNAAGKHRWVTSDLAASR